jgi:hypothetical protein
MAFSLSETPFRQNETLEKDMMPLPLGGRQKDRKEFPISKQCFI